MTEIARVHCDDCRVPVNADGFVPCAVCRQRVIHDGKLHWLHWEDQPEVVGGVAQVLIRESWRNGLHAAAPFVVPFVFVPAPEGDDKAMGLATGSRSQPSGADAS